MGVGDRMASLDRRTPTILNSAWGEAFSWDGDAKTLEEQALNPIQAEDEMNMPLDRLIGLLEGVDAYRILFDRVFPDSGITPDNIAKAIATFERTVVSAAAPFDRWIAGDETAISAEAKRGVELFTEKARCSAGHSGWRFTDDSFHDVASQSATGVTEGLDYVKSTTTKTEEAASSVFKASSELKFQADALNAQALAFLSEVRVA